MKRVLRWLFRVVGVLTVAVAAGVVAAITVLPSMIEGRAIAALRDLGLTDVELDVRFISLTGADIAGIRIGPGGRFRVGHVRLDYHPRRLLDRRIDRIAIDGFFLDARLHDGRVDLGPLERFRQSESPMDARQIPFDHLTVKSSVLSLEVDGQNVLVPFEASLDATGERLAIELAARPLDGSIVIVGDLGRDMNDASLAVDGTLPDLNAWIERSPIARERLPGTLTGEVEFSVRLHGTPAEVQAEATMSATRLAWHGVLGQRLASSTGIRVDLTHLQSRFLVDEGTATVDRLELAVTAPRVVVEGQPPWEVSAQVTSDGDGADIELQAHSLDGAGDRVVVSSRVDRLDGGVVRATGPVEMTVAAATLLRFLPRDHDRSIDIDGPGGVTLSTQVAAEVRTDGSSWRVELPRGEVRANLPKVAFGDGACEGIHCDASFRCEINPAGATLELGDGSAFGADACSIVDPCGAWGLDVRGSDAIRAELTRPLRIVAPPGGEDWRVDGPGWAARVRDGSLWTDRSGALFDGVAIDLSGAVAMEPGRVTGAVHAPSHLSIHTLRSPPTVAWTKADPAADLLRVEFSEDVTVDAELGAEDRAWRMSAPRLRLRVAEGDVLATTQGVRLEGVALDWTVGARCTQDGGAVTAIGDGALSVRSGAAAIAGTPATLSALTVSLRPPENGEFLRVELTEDGVVTGGWRATTTDVSLAAADAGVVKLDRIDVELAVTKAGDRLVGTSRVAVSGSATSVEPAELPWTRLQTGVFDVDVVAHGEVDPAERRVTSWDLRARAESRTDQTIRVEAAGVDARCGSVVAETRCSGTSGPPREVTGRLTLADASIRHPERRLVMTNIAVDIPFAHGVDGSTRGGYEVGSMWLGDDYLSGLSGGVEVSDRRLDVDLAWPILGEVTVTGSGFLEAGKDGPSGRLQFSVPRFEASPTTQPADLFQRLAGVELGGWFALDAAVDIDGQRVEPRVTLTLEGASVSSKAWDASIEGIDASITLDRLSPPATPGQQRVSVKRATVGELVVDGGELVFRLEGPRSLFIERTSWRWAGGRLHSHAIRLDPQDPEFDFVLLADQIQLSDLASIVAPGKVTGEGRLYGRLPLKIAWPDLSYGEGYLYAEPGLGRIQIHDLGPLWVQVPKEARGALRDFEFAVLKAKLEEAGEAKVRLRGKSRDPAYPREIILDVNVHGFDRLLDTAIIVGRLSSVDSFPRK